MVDSSTGEKKHVKASMLSTYPDHFFDCCLCKKKLWGGKEVGDLFDSLYAIVGTKITMRLVIVQKEEAMNRLRSEKHLSVPSGRSFLVVQCEVLGALMRQFTRTNHGFFAPILLVIGDNWDGFCLCCDRPRLLLHQQVHLPRRLVISLLNTSVVIFCCIM